VQKKRYSLFIVFLSIFLLTACNGNIEKNQEEAIARAQNVFFAGKTEPNHEMDALSLYLPFGMEIDATNPYNILLTKGDHSYILFINPHESLDSQVIYETTIQAAQDLRIQEQFTDEGKFGFIIIQDVDRDRYSLTVGIGGIKITTETDANNLPKEAEMMMKIVSSITLKTE